MRPVYRFLSRNDFILGAYRLVAIRDEDKEKIRQWRNEQIDILRQKEPLTKEQQELYFKTVIANLFVKEKPEQVLFSVLENDTLIGYGGLVHIDWESRNGEISFINDTSRSGDQFVKDWKVFLRMLKEVASDELNFRKIYTYAYDVRPLLIKALTESSFLMEARLKDHIVIRGQYQDVVIHSLFLHRISLRSASPEDARTYFDWVNDEEVRASAFNSAIISWQEHENWFKKKLDNPNCIMVVASFDSKLLGQVRFDEVAPTTFEIDFSIDRTFRGKGLGGRLIKAAVMEFQARRPEATMVIGKVKKENVASGKSFVTAGFVLLEGNENKEVDIYALKLTSAI